MGWFAYASLMYKVRNIKGTWGTALFPEMSLYGGLRTDFTDIYKGSRKGQASVSVANKFHNKTFCTG